MAIDNHYPNITWAQFAVCNDDVTTNFESLTRRLFQREFVEEGTRLIIQGLKFLRL